MSDARFAFAAILAASAAILGAAFAFQYVGGLQPCVLCLWQRWPYAATIALSAVGLALGGGRLAPILLAACALAFLIGGGVAVFHVGVEQHWWQGAAECGGVRPPSGSIEELRARLLATAVVRCDEVAWSLLGVSMAGYNALLSLALAAWSLSALRRALTTSR